MKFKRWSSEFASVQFTIRSLISQSSIYSELLFCLWSCFIIYYLFAILYVTVVFPALFLQETWFSPWYAFGSSIADQLFIYEWIFFWALYFFHWFVCLHLLFHVPISQFSLSCFEAREDEITNLFHDIFWLLRVLHGPI